MPMKPSKARTIALIVTAVGILSACGIGGIGGPGSNQVVVTITNKPISIPQGTTYVFTGAASSGGVAALAWTLGNSVYANIGSLSPSTGSPVTYTAPPSPPVYTAPGPVPGTVTIGLGEAPTGASDTATFVITAPSVTVAASPTAASVPLGSTALITAYAIGSVNNALIWQVNGVTGGSAATGTITSANAGYGIYKYTAPATLPMSGNTVTVTVLSQADPSKSASTVITLH